MALTRRWLLVAGGLVAAAGATGAAAWLLNSKAGLTRRELVVLPVWDTYVNEARPTESFGKVRELHTDGSPTVRSYVRFDIPATTGRLVAARLRLYANAADHTGVLVAAAGAGLWAESMTWSSAPPAGAVAAQGGSVEAGHWIDIAIGSVVIRPGPLLLVLFSASETMANYASLDAGEPTAPHLILVTEQP
jgi:hypothetical protein